MEDGGAVRSIDDLPEELIEFILLHLTPYGDLQNCMLVNSRWCRLSKGSMYRLHRLFHRCDRFDWYLLHTVDAGGPAAPPIAERCSHAAAYAPKNNAMLVFGGCTAAYTSFNDLWKFDLSRRTWSRLVPTGAYPTPKACASLVTYDGRMVLFGGWAKSSPNPIHQTAMFFNELHLYDPAANVWTELHVEGDSPHLAGHSAIVLTGAHLMIVFGGSFGNASSNLVWAFDLRRRQWRQVATTSPKPAPRYGQSMAKLDESNVLIVGGCGGPNMIFNDAWLLTVPKEADAPWIWTLLQSRNPELAAPQLWSHAACQVGDKLVTLSRPPRADTPHRRYMSSSAPRLNPDGVRNAGRGDAAPAPARRSEFMPPQGNLIPPRRKLLTSRSLDEQVPPGTGQRSGSDAANDSAALRAARAHADTIHRARSIPAIIVGEIPKLVVTNEAADDGNDGDERPGPSGGALPRPAPIAMSESSLLPNQAVPVNSSAPPSPCLPSGHHRALGRQSSGGRPSVRPNASADRARQLEMLRRMEEHIRRQRSAASLGSSDGRSAPHSADSSPRFRPRSPPPAKSRTPDSPPSPAAGDAPPADLAAGASGNTAGGGDGKHAGGSSAPADRRHSDSSRLPMAMYVLETADALSEHRRSVTWRVVQSPRDAPSDTILYSLVAARGELLLFGGMRSAIAEQQAAGLDVTPFTHTITNETYILRPVVTMHH